MPTRADTVIRERRRQLTGKHWTVVSVIGVAFSLYQLYTLQVAPADPWILRSVHTAFACIIGFLLFSSSSRSLTNRFQIVDVVLSLASAGVVVYVVYNFDELVFRLGMLPTSADVVVSSVLILLILELTRRTVGLPLVILAVAFLVYHEWR